MKYYKLLTDEVFINIATSSDFKKINPNNGWLLTSDENSGQFVSLGGKLYRDYWMQPITTSLPYEQVYIREITEEEYNALKPAIDNGDEIPVDDDDEDEPIVIPVEDDDPDVTLEYTKAAKVKEMSTACRRTIENGIDLELRGEIRHFSLDTQDQLNLISLSAMAQTQSLIPYHADGELCIFYTNEEINEIVETATAFKVYHTTYYNALKGYINALDSIEAIAAIEYGTEIPDEYKSDVLKALEQ